MQNKTDYQLNKLLQFTYEMKYNSSKQLAPYNLIVIDDQPAKLKLTH